MCLQIWLLETFHQFELRHKTLKRWFGPEGSILTSELLFFFFYFIGLSISSGFIIKKQKQKNKQQKKTWLDIICCLFSFFPFTLEWHSKALTDYTVRNYWMRKATSSSILASNTLYLKTWVLIVKRSKVCPSVGHSTSRAVRWRRAEMELKCRAVEWEHNNALVTKG